MGPFQVVKLPEREADHSPPTDVKIIAPNSLPPPPVQIRGVMHSKTQRNVYLYRNHVVI